MPEDMLKDLKEMCTVKELAHVLRISQGTIRAAIRDKSLKAYKVGEKLIRIRKADVIQWIEG